MSATKEMKVQEAIRSMRKLGIFIEYVEEFEKNGKVLIYEDFIGYQIEDPKLLKKIEEIENNGNCVYAVTHDYTDFGELYDFLIVPKESVLWECNIDDLSAMVKTAYSYVWKKSEESECEFRRIVIQSFGGGIKRFFK